MYIWPSTATEQSHPFENPVATVREIDPVPFVFRGLNVALFDVGSGDQVFVWREAPGHGNETEGTRLVCRKTDDFGYTFKLPTGAGNSGPVETLVYTDSSSDTRNFASGPMSSSRLGIMAARVNSDGSHNDPVFVYSDDAGVTWTSATIAGLTGPTWNFHSKIYPHPAGGASAYICYYYTSTGIGYLKTTDNGATWAEGVDVIEPDATFVSISEMSVARVDDQNKWVMGIRTGAGENMAISTSSDMTTWTAIADSGLKLGSNPPELLYHDNKIWVLAFSRRDKPIIDEYENAVVIAGANASQVYNVPSAWDDWQVISALPFFPTGYISTAKIRNRWHGLFNMENYAGSTQSDTGTLMMLSSDTAARPAQRVPNPNLYVNGSLRQWPMGTTITGTTRAAVVPGMTFARSSSVGGWTISRQTGTYGPYAMRIQRDDANAGTQAMIAVINLPVLVSRALAGKQVTVSLRARKGSGFSAADSFLGIQLRQTSEASEQSITSASGSFTTGDTAVGTSSSGITLTENFQRFSLTPARISADTQQICLRIFWTPVGTAASDYIDIEEIKIEAGNEATRFVYDDLYTEKQRCERFAQAFSTRSVNGDVYVAFAPRMHQAPTVSVSVGSASNVSAGGFTLTHNAAADCSVTAGVIF